MGKQSIKRYVFSFYTVQDAGDSTLRKLKENSEVGHYSKLES